MEDFEDVARRTIKLLIESNDPNAEYEFSNHLTGKQRKIAHDLSEEHKDVLYSCSIGDGPNRVLKLFRSKERFLQQVEQEKIRKSKGVTSAADLTLDVRRKFCKDFGIIVPVYDSPYFEYYLEVLNPTHNTKDKLEILFESIRRAGNQDSFTQKWNTIKTDVVKQTMDKPEWKTFREQMSQNRPKNKEEALKIKAKQQSEKDKYKHKSKDKEKDEAVATTTTTTGGPATPMHGGCDIYRLPNSSDDSKFYCSVDLIKANFNSLLNSCPALVNNADSYEAWMSAFTDLPYFYQSKYYRQVIFGNLGIGMHNLMRALLQPLYESDKLKPYFNLICSYGFDEIIWVAKSREQVLEIKKKVIEAIEEIAEKDKGVLKRIGRLEVFQLKQLGGVGDTKDGKVHGFVKEVWKDEEGKERRKDFKHIEPWSFMQCYKRHMGLEINQWDLKVDVHNMVATMDESIFNVPVVEKKVEKKD